jgi:hypothetical protein
MTTSFLNAAVRDLRLRDECHELNFDWRRIGRGSINENGILCKTDDIDNVGQGPNRAQSASAEGWASIE